MTLNLIAKTNIYKIYFLDKDKNRKTLCFTAVGLTNLKHLIDGLAKDERIVLENYLVVCETPNQKEPIDVKS